MSKLTPFEKLIAQYGDNTYPHRTQHRRYTKDGHEIMDPTPIAPPLGYDPNPSMFDIVRLEILKNNLRQLHLEQQWENETIEEADDFDVDDEFPMESRWENDYDPSIKELTRRVEELQTQIDQQRAAAADARAEGLRVPEPKTSSVQPGADISPEPAPPPSKGGTS